ncbi:MAG: type II toxin-antitoxin system VapC family toxin [Blastocatellia bacterium]
MKTSRAFWDTSAILPLCCHQDTSHELRRLRRRRPNVAVWWGMMVEARSALTRLLREGKLSANGLQQAISRLEAQSSSWLEVLPSSKVKNLAVSMPEQYNLRALDSFQLAAALVWCRERPRGRLFVCCDVVLTEAAVKAEFDVSP